MKNTLRRLVLGAATAAAAVTGFACAQTAPQNAELTQKWKDRSMYTIQTRTLEGQPANLADYKGKVVLIVNVASKCGFTPQYSDLEKLNQKFKDKGLVILGFPCNDFGGQEPGSAKEIRDFCTTTYPVTFPMMEKVQVKTGPGQSELFEFLGTRTGKLPGWNFSKYLVGKDGQPIAFYASSVKPGDAALQQAIEQALAK
ncbi:MAG: glutathione peroxidase [Planctomycetaceae bacterium]|jgi:glutathione peroxidase|nr:glutathione peroxidase [Planctomycetaceae bacterium]